MKLSGSNELHEPTSVTWKNRGELSKLIVWEGYRSFRIKKQVASHARVTNFHIMNDLCQKYRTWQKLRIFWRTALRKMSTSKSLSKYKNSRSLFFVERSSVWRCKVHDTRLARKRATTRELLKNSILADILSWSSACYTLNKNNKIVTKTHYVIQDADERTLF